MASEFVGVVRDTTTQCAIIDGPDGVQSIAYTLLPMGVEIGDSLVRHDNGVIQIQSDSVAFDHCMRAAVAAIAATEPYQTRESILARMARWLFTHAD